MAKRTSSLSIISLAYLLFLAASGSADPVPTPWPAQFHSITFMNSTKGKLQVTDLWYDYPNGRNFNIIQKQLGEKLYDLEWDNGTSFYYTLDANKKCKVRHFPVGILVPNWLSGAKYLGQVVKDGFLCNAWTKVDFIWYYEDVLTKRPVSWTFFTGMSLISCYSKIYVLINKIENFIHNIPPLLYYFNFIDFICTIIVTL